MAQIALAEAIQCLLIPLRENHLILPNAAVAEILFFTDIIPLENSPPWYLGSLSWRNLPIPVVCIESAINSEAAPAQHHKQKYAVLKALGEDPGFRFFAIRTEGIPRLVRVDRATISAAGDEQETASFVKKHVQVNKNQAIIPDLDLMEQEIKNILNRSD